MEDFVEVEGVKLGKKVVVFCPFCRRFHYHGAEGRKKTLYRMSHCQGMMGKVYKINVVDPLRSAIAHVVGDEQ
ncbi:hypothetical protein [Geoglobus acetivorans]|uniref:Uncharacterized protein n=1 Tax=Geoglobus acetivorans TaxID=565033 RepID=A0A0A7GEB7_GEOAI|nr:hypothetical protein GACE_1161 [Geoglobus acetivorans]